MQIFLTQRIQIYANQLVKIIYWKYCLKYHVTNNVTL